MGNNWGYSAPGPQGLPLGSPHDGATCVELWLVASEMIPLKKTSPIEYHSSELREASSDYF